MNDKPEIEVGKLPVITKFIYTLGVLPTSYLMSMTYQEQVTWLYNYLQTQVIPAINTDVEAVQELQNLYELLRTYVNDYFDNLDVQEEINNKLDEMTQDGSLTNLIKNYVDPIIDEQNLQIDNLTTLINALGNETPIPVSSTSDMTDTTKIYVNTTDGKWYYYDSDSWEIGGTYQSTGIGEQSIYLKMLEINLQNNFKATMSEINNITWNTGGYYFNNGNLFTNEGYAYSNPITVNPNEIYLYPYAWTSSVVGVTLWDTNNDFVDYIHQDEMFKPFEIPSNVRYIKLNKRLTSSPYYDGKLYKVTNYYLNGQSKLSYGDMDEAFQNSFIPTYEDITSILTFNTGYYDRTSSINGINITNGSDFKYVSIPVTPGEIYRLSGSIIGNVIFYELIGNDGDSITRYPTQNPTGRGTYQELEVVIPDNVYLLHVSGYKDDIFSGEINIKIEKINGYTFTGYDISQNYDIEQLKTFNIEQQLKNDFKWSSSISNGKYATFTFDDSRTDISTIETLFESKNVPCCFATIPSRLNETTQSGETVKEVLQRAITNGGEVLSHYDTPLTSSSSDSDYINVYINTKKTLYSNGFDVNGIITTGGTNYNTQNFAKDIKIARNNYLYADLTATGYTSIEQYFNRRNFIDSKQDTLNLIDNYVNGTDTQPYSKWLNFASHGTSEINIQDLEDIIDYCLTNNVQIVTWKYLFDNFKSSELEKRIEQLEQ